MGPSGAAVTAGRAVLTGAERGGVAQAPGPETVLMAVALAVMIGPAVVTETTNAVPRAATATKGAVSRRIAPGLAVPQPGPGTREAGTDHGHETIPPSVRRLRGTATVVVSPAGRVTLAGAAKPEAERSTLEVARNEAASSVGTAMRGPSPIDVPARAGAIVAKGITTNAAARVVARGNAVPTGAQIPATATIAVVAHVRSGAISPALVMIGARLEGRVRVAMIPRGARRVARAGAAPTPRTRTGNALLVGSATVARPMVSAERRVTMIAVVAIAMGAIAVMIGRPVPPTGIVGQRAMTTAAGTIVVPRVRAAATVASGTPPLRTPPTRPAWNPSRTSR